MRSARHHGELSHVDDYRFSWTERRTIQAIADTATRDAKQLLPTLPDDLVLDVRAEDDVIEELGYRGTPGGHTAYWLVDPSRSEGVVAIADEHLRSFIFFACYRVVREQTVKPVSLMDFVISGALETAFVRDSAGGLEPWADYPTEVANWVAELRSVQETEPLAHWMRRHPDGRRWIGLKAGTYLVDRAMRASGQSAAELVSASTEEVLSLAR